MRIKIPMMVDDIRFGQLGKQNATENIEIEGEFFLDGPVTRKVAVVDLDPDTGALEPGARFIAAKPDQTFGYYWDPGEAAVPRLSDVPKNLDVYSRWFNQVSAFATVHKAMQLYEEPEVLGRPVTWAFDSPQLFVVPRAGEMENAFYARDTHSLQFFYFKDHTNPQNTIYTSLARDVVAHETGHAILDGIAPHLWDAITPQSLALHEGIGDLTALLVSMASNKLVKAVLHDTQGSIKNSTHFSAIAEDFGMGRGTGALRSLLSPLKMSDVERADPHDLCVVVTAALYAVLIQMHEQRKQQRMQQIPGTSEFSASGWALAVAAAQFRAMAFRALDYMPPGEISFADYGRAIVAAHQVSYPNDPEIRDLIARQFVDRGIIPDVSALNVALPPDDLSGLDLEALVDSDWAAYRFADSRRGRDLLCIPDDVPFTVERRLRTTKCYHHGGGVEEMVDEVLFKVWWMEVEGNDTGFGFPSTRQIAAGTTLSWDTATSKPRVLLTSGRQNRPEEKAEQQKDRDELLRRLAGQGLLRSGRSSLAPDGKPWAGVITTEGDENVLKVSGGARMLHMVGEV